MPPWASRILLSSWFTIPLFTISFSLSVICICRQRAIRSALKTQRSSSAIAPHHQQNDDHSADKPFHVLSVAFTELVEALAVAENFKKRERLSILLRTSLNRKHKGVDGTNDRARHTHADGLMRAEFPKKLPEALRYSGEILKSIALIVPGCDPWSAAVPPKPGGMLGWPATDLPLPYSSPRWPAAHRKPGSGPVAAGYVPDVRFLRAAWRPGGQRLPCSWFARPCCNCVRHRLPLV